MYVLCTYDRMYVCISIVDGLHVGPVLHHWSNYVQNVSYKPECFVCIFACTYTTRHVRMCPRTHVMHRHTRTHTCTQAAEELGPPPVPAGAGSDRWCRHHQHRLPRRVPAHPGIAHTHTYIRKNSYSHRLAHFLSMLALFPSDSTR